MDEALKKTCARCILNFVSCVKKGALYSTAHPVVQKSVGETFSSLQQALRELDALHINLSADNRILVEGQVIEGRESLLSGLIPFLKKWQVEDMTFARGITNAELLSLVGILLWNDAQVAGVNGEISRACEQEKITHVQLNLFSYKRVKKGEEVTVSQSPADIDVSIPEKESALDKLKVRFKEIFGRKKAPKTEEIDGLARAVYVVVIGELKDGRKLSTATRNMLTKFLVKSGNTDLFLDQLKESMRDAGINDRDVLTFSRNIEEAVLKKQTAARRVSAAGLETLQKENERLRTEQIVLKKELQESVATLEAVKRQANVVRDEKVQLDNIVHNMSDGMLAVDPAGKILMANATAEELLGITKEDVGKQLKEVIKDEHLLALVKPPQPGKQGQGTQDVELYSHDEAAMRVLRASSAMVEDHQGKTVGMVAVLNDVTKQKELNRMKQEFLAKVTHELRTPLVAMAKSIELLRAEATGPLSENQDNFLSMTERNLKRLSALINDLLDLSRLEAGKLQIRREPGSLRQAITETVNVLSAWAKAKTIGLSQQVPDDLPAAEFDYDRIIQVMHNLIGNALKFTPDKGSITVSASCVGAKEIRVSVQDTGAGMSKEEASHVFDKFYQVKGELTGKVPGTGIGLSIAREIIELHGGKIWVESEQGKGTSFLFTLPLKAPAPGNDKT